MTKEEIELLININRKEIEKLKKIKNKIVCIEKSELILLKEMMISTLQVYKNSR